MARLDVSNIPRVMQWLSMLRPDAPLLLDVFCGAGGAAVGYWRAGFNVIGVDHKPQSRYPFPFVQMDAIEAIRVLGPYADAIHASPPCQGYSKLQHLANVKVENYPRLLEPVRKAMRATGHPFVIENVPGAPLQNPITLWGDLFGLRIIRDRGFECSFLIDQPVLAFTAPVPLSTCGARGEYSSFANGASHITVAGNNYAAADGRAAMGIHWMANRAELSESIPPAYTEYIGRHLMRVMRPETTEATARDGGAEGNES